MSKTIDEKVVEMRFDNQQFEKGVATTINSIKNLEKSCNMTPAVQEFENFAAKRYEENDAFFVKMFTDSGVMKSIVDMLKPIIYRKMRKKK